MLRLTCLVSICRKTFKLFVSSRKMLFLTFHMWTTIMFWKNVFKQFFKTHLERHWTLTMCTLSTSSCRNVRTRAQSKATTTDNEGRYAAVTWRRLQHKFQTLPFRRITALNPITDNIFQRTVRAVAWFCHVFFTVHTSTPDIRSRQVQFSSVLLIPKLCSAKPTSTADFITYLPAWKKFSKKDISDIHST